jgi:hypothetical protein
MPWKFYALTLLSLATVTACAHPLDRVVSDRAALRQEEAEKTATISGGACDDVGQFIPARDANTGQMTLEASAAPFRRH